MNGWTSTRRISCAIAEDARASVCATDDAHRTHGYAGQMLTKSKGWSFAALTFGELRAQRSRFAGMGSSTVQQAELEEAARLARIGYEAAFEGMEASAVVAGADRLRRTLKRARQRHGAEHDGRTSDG